MTNTEFALPQDFSPTIEKETKNKIADFSGLEKWYISQQLEPFLPFITRAVVFPDLGPTKERKTVPTGSVTEFNIEQNEDCLKFVMGADIGCAMVKSDLDFSEHEFKNDQNSLDEVYSLIKANKDVDLGGGNHFIDFVSNKKGKVSVVVHTGAPRDKQKELSAIISNRRKGEPWPETTSRYQQEYQNVIESGFNNRLGIVDLIYKVYGKGNISFHEPHNTVEIDKKSGLLRIYKGVIHVKDKSKRLLLPSSMGSPMDFYLPGETIGIQTLWGAPHGTGRSMPRKEVKYVAGQTPNIMFVSGITPPHTELPHAYRKLRGESGAETTMLSKGLIKYETEEDLEELIPIAYIGHI